MYLSKSECSDAGNALGFLGGIFWSFPQSRWPSEMRTLEGGSLLRGQSNQRALLFYFPAAWIAWGAPWGCQPRPWGAQALQLWSAIQGNRFPEDSEPSRRHGFIWFSYWLGTGGKALKKPTYSLKKTLRFTVFSGICLLKTKQNEWKLQLSPKKAPFPLHLYENNTYDVFYFSCSNKSACRLR